jgi:hypothetical protein
MAAANMLYTPPRQQLYDSRIIFSENKIYFLLLDAEHWRGGVYSKSVSANAKHYFK